MVQTKIIGIANIFGAFFFIFALPQLEGGRFLAAVILSLTHVLIAIGFFLKLDWARAIMLVYSTFQLFALATATVVSILSLQYRSFSLWTGTILFLFFTVGPFLAWTIHFLLTNKSIKEQEA